ncbi:MAG: hypothetical protein IPH13_13290 [Planctomycetes bacterium]|nr:hypothetical protein [Planctomycetota bacterium]
MRVLDDFSSGKTKNLASVVDRVQVMVGDAADPDAVGRAVAGVDVVFHEAAIASVQRSVDQPLTSQPGEPRPDTQSLTASARCACDEVGLRGVVRGLRQRPVVAEDRDHESGPEEPLRGRQLGGEHSARGFCPELRPRHRWRCDISTSTVRANDPSSPYSAVIPSFIGRLLDGKRPRSSATGSRRATSSSSRRRPRQPAGR